MSRGRLLYLLAVFAMLAVIMLLTRRVDWYAAVLTEGADRM